MAVAAAPLALAAAGFQVAGSLMGAQGKADGAQAQADQAERAAQVGKLRAAQTDTSMRQNLTSSLANISAVRAAAVGDDGSPTGAAIMSSVEARGDANRAQQVGNINAQVASDEAAAKFYHKSASNAILGGYLGAAGAIAGAAGGAYKSMGSPSTGTQW